MELIHPEVFLILALVFLCIVVAVLTVYILFLVNLKKMLDQVNPDNRVVAPANVFLMLIPVFSFIYGFILFPKISESLRKEYESRGMILPGDGLKLLGSVIAGLSWFTLIVVYLKVPLSTLASLALFVIFIIYWVQSARIKKELRRSGTNARVDILD